MLMRDITDQVHAAHEAADPALAAVQQQEKQLRARKAQIQANKALARSNKAQHALTVARSKT